MMTTEEQVEVAVSRKVDRLDAQPPRASPSASHTGGR